MPCDKNGSHSNLYCIVFYVIVLSVLFTALLLYKDVIECQSNLFFINYKPSLLQLF